MATPQVSLIVPCSGNAPGLLPLLPRLDAMRATGVMDDWEVVFVNDGSLSGVGTILNRLMDQYEWIRVVHHQTSRGPGAAIRTGFKYTDAPFVCTMDCDCAFPPENLPAMVDMLRAGADLVTASPSEWDNEKAARPGVRRLLRRGTSLFYQLVLGSTVQSFLPMHRAYRRSLIERIHFRSNGSFAVGEIMAKSLFHGFRVKEVPTEAEELAFDGSTINMFDSIMGHVSLMRMAAGMAAGGWVRQRIQWGRYVVEE